MSFWGKLHNGKPTLSFEFFPPKSAEGWIRLYETIAQTARLHVDMVSVTYGAGGSTRENTLDLVARLQGELGITAMAHLTCVGHTRWELSRLLDRLSGKRVPLIMALRGDPPQGEGSFQPCADGFAFASELIAFIRQGWPHFKIGCAAYPEGHAESLAQGMAAPDHDIGFLKLKQEQGADFAVTQMFFDNSLYLRFVDRARAAGVTMPLLPGIMPLQSAGQLERFVELAGCAIPEKLRLAAQDEDVPEAGYGYALEQCRELVRSKVPGLHLYTLNQSQLSVRLVRQLRDEFDFTSCD